MLQRLKDVFRSFADRDVRYVVIRPSLTMAIVGMIVVIGSRTAASHVAPGVKSVPASSIVVPATQLRGVVLRPRDGDTRLVLQPGGPFALMIFRDGTLGEHLAVLYHGPLPRPRDGGWALDDRWWQDPLWSTDANAWVWSPDGKALYLSTGDRGSGSVFRLDLRSRRARRLWPNDEASTPEQGAGRSCEIMSADAGRRLLRVRYQPASTQRPIAVDVRME